VTRGDLDGLLLHVAPAADIAGRVTVEDAPTGPFPIIGVTLGPAEGIFYGMSTVKTAVDGSFLIRGAEPAPFLLNVSGLPPNMYLKTVRYAGRDVTGMPIDLAAGAAGLLEIVLSPKAAMVTGLVHDASGAPLPAAFAFLWDPRDPQPFGPTILGQTIRRVPEDGRFLFTNLKPGTYKLLAFAATLFDSENFYDWIDKFADRALTVKVEEGSQQALDPPVITPD
jgi:hypothetical protein